MKTEAIIYGMGGLAVGDILTVLLGLTGMAGMMGMIGGRMMGICGNQGSIKSPLAERVANRQDQVLQQ